MSKQFYLKQFISTQLSSTWPIDRTLSGATTLGQSEPGSDGIKGSTQHSQKLQHYWSLTIKLLSVIHLFGLSYSSAEVQSVYSKAPADWARKRAVLTLCAPVKCTSATYHGRIKVSLYYASRIPILPVCTNFTSHCPRKATPFISLWEDNFYIFFRNVWSLT